MKVVGELSKESDNNIRETTLKLMTLIFSEVGH